MPRSETSDPRDSVRGEPRTPGKVIAGRYELRGRIAQGGMGEVLRAWDRVRASEIAVKRLKPGHRQHELMFRAEYHALARLKHPYIIEVHEFGVDRRVPYYTMELLDGKDLLDAPPTGLTESCRMLRDLATSLALLHSQRLLHRDISPRNVRRTSSGRCKLLDFGLMLPFGVPPNLAGTPPFVAPEAWEGSLLDQRSDLYSLGAVAYWLFTRTFPYEPKVAAQHGVTRAPPPVRMRVRLPDLPPALDELVMSLLELDPARRPSSAAELISRLNDIAGLAPEDGVALGQSYLHSARFVGRQPELARVEQAFDAALEGKGSSWVVAGPSGIGRTRFVQELSLRAQTRGLRVVRAFSARAPSSGELVREIYQCFRRAAPDALERIDARDRDAVRAFDSETRVHVPVTGSGVYTRDAQHAALVSYVHHATAQGAWLLLVDDLDIADQFSVGFVTALAREAEARSLVVLVTARGSDETLGAGRAALFARDAHNVFLADLDQDETRALAATVFGDAPNLERVAAWLYRAARGNPSLTMELALVLLRRGIVRYVEGAFLLPPDEIEMRVPSGLVQALLLRLEPVSEAALRFAELVSLCRGAATLELCLRASELSAEETLSLLEELVRHGVLISVRGAYAFAQDAMRGAVSNTLSKQRADELHARLAAAFLADGTSDLERTLEAGWHLLHTPRELEGARLLSRITPTLFATDLSYAGAIQAAEKALLVYERLGAPLAERVAMRALLVRAGYLYDYKLALTYGEETVAMLERWLCLDLLRPLIPYLGGRFVLLAMFLLTTLRYLLTWGEGRGPTAYRALQYLGRSGMSLLGVYVLGLDARRAGKMLARLAPLAAAPDASSGKLLYASASALAIQPLGREVEVREGNQQAVAVLNRRRPLGMSEREHLDMRVGLMLSAGINECYRVGSTALDAADALEAVGTQIGRAAAQRIRLTYHVVRGGKEAAERHRRLLEVHAIQGGTTWQVEWFAVPVEGMASARLGDLVTARASLERLEQLVLQVPSLVPLRDMVRIMYQYRRGNIDAALTLGEAFVREHPPRSVIGWPSAYCAYAAALNDSGRHLEALALCEQATSLVSEEHREYAFIYGHIERELAFSYAAVGQAERADALTQRNIARYEQAGEHVLLCMEHESAARIARFRGDRDAVERSLARMRNAAEDSCTPFAVEYARRTQGAFMRALSVQEPDKETSPDQPRVPSSRPPRALVVPNTPLHQGTRFTARRVLLRVMAQAGASSAFLFRLGPQGDLVTAASSGGEPPAAVEESVRNLAASPRAGVDAQPRKRRLHTIEAQAATYDVILLPRRDSGDTAAVLALGHERAVTRHDLSESVLERLATWVGA